jgi:hypothetical protein
MGIGLFVGAVWDGMLLSTVNVCVMVSATLTVVAGSSDVVVSVRCRGRGSLVLPPPAIAGTPGSLSINPPVSGRLRRPGIIATPADVRVAFNVVSVRRVDSGCLLLSELVLTPAEIGEAPGVVFVRRVSSECLLLSELILIPARIGVAPGVVCVESRGCRDLVLSEIVTAPAVVGVALDKVLLMIVELVTISSDVGLAPSTFFLRLSVGFADLILWELATTPGDVRMPFNIVSVEPIGLRDTVLSELDTVLPNFGVAPGVFPLETTAFGDLMWPERVIAPADVALAPDTVSVEITELDGLNFSELTTVVDVRDVRVFPVVFSVDGFADLNFSEDATTPLEVGMTAGVMLVGVIGFRGVLLSERVGAADFGVVSATLCVKCMGCGGLILPPPDIEVAPGAILV